MASAVFKWWMRIHGGGSAYIAPAPTTNAIIQTAGAGYIIQTGTTDKIIQV